MHLYKYSSHGGCRHLATDSTYIRLHMISAFVGDSVLYEYIQGPLNKIWNEVEI